MRERTPILVLAGDTAVVDKENIQSISQRDIVMPTGAGFEQLRTPETLGEDVAVAIHRAHTERRPVVLNIPVDFQWLDVEYEEPQGVWWVRPSAATPGPDDLDVAAGIVASAKRPIVLAGRGGGQAREALVRLANRIGAPLATTLRGRDLFRGEPHDLHIFGTLSHEIASEVIADSDCVIAFGAGLNKWTTADHTLLKGKAVVQIDSDLEAIGRFEGVTAGVHGDSGAVATALADLLDEAEVPSSGYASEALAKRLAEFRVEDTFIDQSTDETVDMRTAILKIDAAFPQDRSLVFDGGRFVMHSYHLFHVKHPNDYVHTVNFGSIGLGLGNAIGAAQAADRPTLLVAGDGGFMLGNVGEFNSAVRHGADLVVVILNDGAYGAEHVQFRAKGMDPTPSMFDWPEFADVAESLGGRGYTVRNLKELDEVLAELPNRDRPVLIDVKLDPDKVTIPH
ncbi:thiamine pyrophosphate-binding protein [Nocardioides alcanivorans]|uniref:thiamine pyrophosphate-binding protein n=1 Tax=Nocardioides alcanivorans TaxID=2897352 RepID=UPI00289A8CE9|nr:thiamine pyrophosphate-binding protein [Nocardioides alcanivorans]